MHVTETSRVADHCRSHALSSPTESELKADCDHDHDMKCDRCNLFPDTMNDIQCTLKESEVTSEENEEMEFLFSQAKQNIESWKSHLLRSVNQDQARQDVIQELTRESALLVSDWAMKFLPRKFRESQQDWFGKRGIPWHLTVAITKTEDGELRTLTFVHIFESCVQDSPAVLAILDDVLQQLKDIAPDIKSLYMKQDNAGCYHSAPTILGIYQVALQHGLNLERIDFSDPQGGKGACDRKAATLKNHMKKYLNSGHDIETAQQMKSAIESFGGLPGVSATLCGIQDFPDMTEIKWEGISFINNVAYSKEGFKFWKAYQVGAGKFMSWKEFNLPNLLPKLNKIDDPDDEISKPAFVPIKARRVSKKTTEEVQEMTKDNDNFQSNDNELFHMGEESTCDDSNDDSDNEVDDKEDNEIVYNPRLFFCPEEGCVKSFQRYTAFEKHIEYGKHKYALEHETLYDKAKILYATRLESGATHVPTMEAEATAIQGDDQVLPKGWALKSSAKRKRFTDDQKKYLIEIFENGESTGRKANPATVAQSMRKAKHQDGTKVFTKNDYLTAQQIASFFSRHARKRKGGLSTDNDDKECEENENDEERRNAEILKEVMDMVSVQHPIMFDRYNICEMAYNSKLSSFSVCMLKEICESFELDVSSISTRRKKPYIELLMSMVDNCCNQK